ncbi:MAG: hypothetical protein LKK19_01505 [Bacteroidales bacterium]|nr:hypothetical protein [Bacteroidales bacterium]
MATVIPFRRYKYRGYRDLILDACDATQSRMAVITLKTEGKNETQTTVTVSQSAKNTVLQIAPTSATAGSDAQNVAFAIAANGDWTVTSSSSWATPDVTSGSGNAIIKVALDENTSHSEDRKAKIVVSAGNDVERVQDEFAVTQLSRSLATIFLTHSSLSFRADAKTAGTNVATVPVITNITGDIRATSEFSWCNAVYSDGVITVTVQDNTGNDARCCIVNVYADVDGDMVLKQIEVNQAGIGDPVLTMLRNSVVVPAYSGDLNDKAQAVSIGYVPSSKGIAVTVEEDYPSWITNVTVDNSNDLVRFNIQASEETSSRSTVITLLAKLGTETASYPITVTQQGVGESRVVISSPSVTFDATGGTVTVNAFANVSQATVSAYSANASWVTVTANSTGGSLGISTDVQITCAANSSAESRTAEVLIPVKVGSQAVYGTVEVIQAGVGAPEVYTTETSVNLPVDGSSHVVTLFGADANTTVKAIVPASWLDAAVTESSVTFTADANTSSAARETTVNLVVTRGGETQIIPIDVKQAGTGSAALLLAKTEYEFEQAGGTYTIPIEPVNGSGYEVVSTPDWIATASTTAPAGIETTVSANPDADGREGNIVILANNGDDYTYYIITTKQYGLEAPEIALGQDEIVIPRKATVGTEGYAVTVAGADASTTVTASSDQPWVEGIVNTAKNSIAIAAEENGSSEKRTATITVVAERGGAEQTLSFNVIQPGTGSAELRMAVTSYSFGPKAVSGFGIPVTCINGTSYTLASNPDWVTITGEGTSILELAVASNESTTESRNGVIIMKAVNGSDATEYGISVSQLGMNGPNVTTAVNSITVPREAISGTERYDVALIGADAATTLSTSSTATWVEGVITATGYLSFKTEENTSSDSREAVVSVIAERAGEQQAIAVKVIQPGTGSAELDIALTNYTFTFSEVDDFVIPVTMLHSTAYTVSAKPEWVSIAGEGTDSLKISIPENGVTDERSGSIVLRAVNGDDETAYTIGITQLGINGPDLVPEFYNITLPRTASNSHFVEIVGMDQYTATTFISSANWLSAAWNDRKDRIYFTAEENTLSAKREATITVQAEKGGQEQQFMIKVTQPGTGSAELEIPHSEYTFTYQGTSLYAIPVNALNGSSWTVSSQNGSGWLTWANEGTEGFVISMAENDLVDSRSEILVFRATNGDDETLYEVKITQMGIDGPAVAALQSSITLPSILVTGTYYKITLDGIDGYTTPITVNENADWLAADYNGTDEYVYFNANENMSNSSRSADVAITATKGGQTEIIYVTVVQLGKESPYIILPFEEYVIGPQYSDYYLFGTTNTDNMTIMENSSSWIYCHFSNVSFPFYDLRITADENHTTESRSCDIIIEATSGEESMFYSLKVTQMGNLAPKIQVVNPNRTVPYTAGSDSVLVLNVNDAIAGTAVSSASWITPVPVSGNKILYTFDENSTDGQRIGTVSVPYFLNGETIIAQITVIQLANGGASLDLSGNQFTFGASGATGFSVGCVANDENTEVSASSDQSWIENAAVSDGELTFGVAENTASDERNGYITLVATHGDSQTVYTVGIVQMGTDGPDVTILENKMDLPCQAVTSEDNKIDLAGVDGSTAITVTDNADWLTVAYDATGKYVYFNTVTNTTDQPRVATASIVAKKNGQMQYFDITVTQARNTGYSYTIYPSTLYFNVNGGFNIFDANYSNISYLEIASTVPAWITFSLPAGYDDGDHQYTMSVGNLGSLGAARADTIEIKYGIDTTDYRIAKIVVSQSDASGFYLVPGGQTVLLPAYITSPSTAPSRRPVLRDTTLVPINHLIVPFEKGADSYSTPSADKDWFSVSNSFSGDGYVNITGLTNNTGDDKRIGWIDFTGTVGGTVQNGQINVIQLKGTDPQLTGYYFYSQDHNFYGETMTLTLAGDLGAKDSVTFTTSNVTTVLAQIFVGYAGYDETESDYNVEASLIDENKVRLKVTANGYNNTGYIRKGTIVLSVGNGNASNEYFIYIERNSLPVD